MAVNLFVSFDSFWFKQILRIEFDMNQHCYYGVGLCNNFSRSSNFGNALVGVGGVDCSVSAITPPLPSGHPIGSSMEIMKIDVNTSDSRGSTRLGGTAMIDMHRKKTGVKMSGIATMSRSSDVSYDEDLCFDDFDMSEFDDADVMRFLNEMGVVGEIESDELSVDSLGNTLHDKDSAYPSSEDSAGLGILSSCNFFSGSGVACDSVVDSVTAQSTHDHASIGNGDADQAHKGVKGPDPPYMSDGKTDASSLDCLADSVSMGQSVRQGCIHCSFRKFCWICNNCGHGRLKEDCPRCDRCPHGGLKSSCGYCSPCIHGFNLNLGGCAICALTKHCVHQNIASECQHCISKRLSSSQKRLARKEVFKWLSLRNVPIISFSLSATNGNQDHSEFGVSLSNPSSAWNVMLSSRAVACVHCWNRNLCRLCNGCVHSIVKCFCRDCSGCTEHRRLICSRCHHCVHGVLISNCPVCSRPGFCFHGCRFRECDQCRSWVYAHSAMKQADKEVSSYLVEYERLHGRLQGAGRCVRSGNFQGPAASMRGSSGSSSQTFASSLVEPLNYARKSNGGCGENLKSRTFASILLNVSRGDPDIMSGVFSKSKSASCVQDGLNFSSVRGGGCVSSERTPAILEGSVSQPEGSNATQAKSVLSCMEIIKQNGIDLPPLTLLPDMPLLPPDYDSDGSRRPALVQSRVIKQGKHSSTKLRSIHVQSCQRGSAQRKSEHVKACQWDSTQSMQLESTHVETAACQQDSTQSMQLKSTHVDIVEACQQDSTQPISTQISSSQYETDPSEIAQVSSFQSRSTQVGTAQTFSSVLAGMDTLSSPCPHCFKRSLCYICNNCGHNSIAEDCRSCGTCKHGRWRSKCVVCRLCMHGNRGECAICLSLGFCFHMVLQSGCTGCEKRYAEYSERKKAKLQVDKFINSQAQRLERKRPFSKRQVDKFINLQAQRLERKKPFYVRFDPGCCDKGLEFQKRLSMIRTGEQAEKFNKPRVQTDSQSRGLECTAPSLGNSNPMPPMVSDVSHNIFPGLISSGSAENEKTRQTQAKDSAVNFSGTASAANPNVNHNDR